MSDGLPDYHRIARHRVDALPSDDRHAWICRQCGAYADTLDELVGEPCPGVDPYHADGLHEALALLLIGQAWRGSDMAQSHFAQLLRDEADIYETAPELAADRDRAESAIGP